MLPCCLSIGGVLRGKVRLFTEGTVPAFIMWCRLAHRSFRERCSWFVLVAVSPRGFPLFTRAFFHKGAKCALFFDQGHHVFAVLNMKIVIPADRGGSPRRGICPAFTAPSAMSSGASMVRSSTGFTPFFRVATSGL